MWRPLSSILFFFALFSLWLPSSHADERILKFDSTIEIQQDGSMIVTEVIKVRTEGRAIKRGIYRDFPTRYKDTTGHAYVVDFKVLEVLKDGRKEPYHLKSQSNGERVYMGSSDVMLQPGIYTYILRYGTNRQLGFFQDHDELYWNVTGNGWDFIIEQVSATVVLPPGVPKDQIGFEAYTGATGSKDKAYRAAVEADGSVRFTTTKPLPSNHGLTIVVSWPKGVVAPPTPTDKAQYFIRDNFIIIGGLAGVVLVFIYYFLIWLVVGKDPNAGVIIPRYEPPANFSPAAIRYIRKMGFDNKTFGTALIELAVRGFLNISQKRRTYTLFKKSGGGPLFREENKLYGQLPSSLELKQKNHATIRGAMKALKHSLSANFEKIYFLKNFKFMIPGFLITLAILLLVLVGLRGPQKETTLVLLIGLSFISFFLFSRARATATQWKMLISGLGNPLISLFSAIASSVILLFVTIAEIAGLVFLGLTSSVGLVIILVLLALTNYLFYGWLKAPTHAGRKILDEIEGFRMYLTMTEKERLNLLNPPDKTPELFEKYLPYALALDVEQLWSEQFSDVLAQAGKEGKTYVPAWYSGNVSDGNFGNMTSSLGDSFSSAIASSSQAPGSSSGGGGGGSSGGGGGGGGGGGW